MKILKTWMASGLTAVWFCTGAVTPVQAETLADALVSAYEHSGLLDQNRALLRAADEDLAVAVSALRPVISWSSTLSYRDNPFITNIRDELSATMNFSADLLVYDFGATQLAVESQKETILATRQSLINIEQQILQRAVDAYMNVIRTSEFVALRQNNVRVITQELRAARDRFEVGEVTRTDVALAEARLASARSSLASAEGDRARAVAEFQVAVGRSPGNLQTPSSRVAAGKTQAEARTIALRMHPTILQAQHEVAATELNIARAEAVMHPTMRASADVDINDQFQGTDSFSLTIANTLYQGGALSAQLRQAQARRDASRAGLHITRHNIEQGVANSFAIFVASNAASQASERQIRASRVAFRGTREEASLGARTTLDVLNAEQELLDAQANLIAAKSDEVIAAYSVLSSMGLLTAEHLGLGVQTYDPAAYYNQVKDAPAVMSEQGAALDRVLRAIGEN
jgi:outer membrane protein